jgi:alanine racemase
MVTSRQLAVTSIRRDAWVEVDLGAIEHNVKIILSWLKKDSTRPYQESINNSTASSQTRPLLMAVVKSDAYGHGVAGVAEVLIGSGASWLAVASVDEGCQIRAIDSKVRVLLLSPVPAWAVQTAFDQNLDLSITSISQISEIEGVAARANSHARVHLKIDSGMHRLGIQAQDLSIVLTQLEKSNHLQLVSVFSHLAKAEALEATKVQNEQFAKIVQTVRDKEPHLIEAGVVSDKEPLLFHLASSDAARRFPFSHYDMVRVGLALYGLEANAPSSEIIPAMSVRARINQIKVIGKGESVGYGWTWTAQRETRLASVPIGYADGVDRGLSNRISGLLMGHIVAQAGRISMDQMLFDITDVPEAQEGDVITLIGREGDSYIDLARWAVMLDTITYELACRMRVRLPRIYTRHRHTPALQSMTEN